MQNRFSSIRFKRSLSWTIFAVTLSLFVFETFGVRPAGAQEKVRRVNHCLAIAGHGPLIHKASLESDSFKSASLKKNQIRISFIGHSSFLIESPDGVKIVTDFTGYAGFSGLPTVVTMNHAHDSHYTDFPDPSIKHVLRGWNPKGGDIHHDVTIKDVHIRSVPTNIRNWGGGTERFGNSIFLFDVAGLCIGHLGHLQHELTMQQLGQIGQLDIVMVPVDGGFTMDHDGMMKVLKKLRARLILPMHFFTPGTVQAFLDKAKSSFAIKFNDTANIIISQKTLPSKPQILVLPGF